MSDQKRDAAQVRTAKLDKSKPYRPKTVEAGANVAGQKKAPSFQDSLKTRADDPRNWEFYFADSAAPDDPWSPKSSMGPKARAAADRKQLALAKSKAKAGGAQLYKTLQIEFETKNIVAGTEKLKAHAAASRPSSGTFGSTAVARNLAAQRSKAKRGGGSGQSRTRTSATRVGSTQAGRNVAAQKQKGQRKAGGGAATSPFDATPQKKSARIA